MTGRILIVVATACLAAASPASASQVLLVRGNHVVPRDDPALPGLEAELPHAPPASCDKPARAPVDAPPAVSAGGPSVRAVLLRDYRKGVLQQPLYQYYRSTFDQAVKTVKRLHGVRRANLHGVLLSLERIAQGNLLTVARMPALFFQLKHNLEFWPSKPLPRIPPPTPSPCRYAPAKKSAAHVAGYVTPVRYVFDDSPIIFEYYPGNGLQIQPLANFGKANALANACKGLYGPKVKCHLDQFKALLDALVSVSSQRAGFTTWEYWFPFGGGRPPWTSGLSQGTAIQALVSGAQLLSDPHYLDVARSAIGAFQTSTPQGVRTSAFGGTWYAQYSFSPHLLILNGFLQALNGIFDFAQAAQDSGAQQLFAEGAATAKRAIPSYDTGAWSLYSFHGRESDLGYHRVVRDFLKGLCQRTNDPDFCGAATRFTDYLKQHPLLSFLGAAGSRHAKHVLALRFTLSKASCVGIQVKRGGRVVFGNRLQMPYGVHGFAWVPRAPGKYTVHLLAIDYLNHQTPASGTVTIRR